MLKAEVEKEKAKAHIKELGSRPRVIEPSALPMTPVRLVLTKAQSRLTQGYPRQTTSEGNHGELEFNQDSLRPFTKLSEKDIDSLRLLKS